MMIDVDPVKAAASETIFVRVQGLEDLLEAVISEDEGLKCLNFFALPIPSPVRRFLTKSIMPVVCEVPVTQKKSKDFVMRCDVVR